MLRCPLESFVIEWLPLRVIFLLKTFASALPSSLKYSVVPPEPSSEKNAISLSSALFIICKSPVLLLICEFVPSCRRSRSLLEPILSILLSAKLILPAKVAFCDVSIVRAVVLLVSSTKEWFE